VGFLAVGAVALRMDGPALIVWSALALGGAGLLAVIVRLRRPPASGEQSATPSSGGATVALRDGRDYRVDVTEDEIVLTQNSTGERRRVPWSALTQVFVIAIDAFPIGGMSFMLHTDSSTLEIPSDSEGNGPFVAAMQEKLPGFDNEAMIEASAMLHGFKRLWTRS
jgi:hypothetical protein